MIESAVERADLRARRNVVSFVRRSNRMRPNQRRAWDAYRDRFVLQVPDAEEFELTLELEHFPRVSWDELWR